MNRVIIAGNRMGMSMLAATHAVMMANDVAKECVFKLEAFSDAMWRCPTMRPARVEHRMNTAPRKARSKYAPHVGAKERACT